MKSKKPIIVIFPLMRKGYCMNLFGTIWTRDASWIDTKIINHERIHTRQMREMLYVAFYVWYAVEWLVKLICYGDSYRAYVNISFEREAYLHGGDLSYLSRRRRYAWVRYLRVH